MEPRVSGQFFIHLHLLSSLQPLQLYIGLIAGTARNASEANQMDALTGAVVMLLVLISYFRLKGEGMEDGMTFMGKPVEDESGFTNSLLLFALIIGALFTINVVLLGS